MKCQPDKARDQQFVDLYRQGKTLKEIGVEYNLTRERVRQVIKRNGVTKKEGGCHLRAVMRKTLEETRNG